MIKIWNEAFWKAEPEGVTAPPLTRGSLTLRVVPVTLLAIVTLGIGFFPQPLLDLAGRAADQLLDPAAYLRAVASGGG